MGVFSDADIDCVVCDRKHSDAVQKCKFGYMAYQAYTGMPAAGACKQTNCVDERRIACDLGEGTLEAQRKPDMCSSIDFSCCLHDRMAGYKRDEANGDE